MTNTAHDLLEYEDVGEDYVVSPSYLFQTESCLVDFVVIQEELEQLHDYCLLCTNAAAAKLRDLDRELIGYKRGKIVADEVIGDITPEVIDGLEHFQIPQWQDTQSFLVTAMCLVLVSALLERGLKMLCTSFAPSGKIPPKEKKGVSKVETYIGFLQNECKLNFREPDSSIHIREDFRKIRNNFAHGDWDNVRRDVPDCSLRAAFEAFSALFSEIEMAFQLHEAANVTKTSA